MNERRVYEILRPETAERRARWFRGGRATLVRRGEPGDCMYFIAAGEVEIELSPEPRRLGTGEFLAGSPC
jgi:CRP-like cAMP-binding protein